VKGSIGDSATVNRKKTERKQSEKVKRLLITFDIVVDGCFFPFGPSRLPHWAVACEKKNVGDYVTKRLFYIVLYMWYYEYTLDKKG
jgi:hypothetical protein